MKRKIVLFCLAASVFAIACSKDNSQVQNDNSDIISVSSHYTGGWGANYATVIRQDSILFVDSSKILSAVSKKANVGNNENIWHAILNSVKLSEFVRLQNGQSTASYDGVDRTIIIKTSTNTYSKINADTTVLKPLLHIIDSIEGNAHVN